MPTLSDLANVLIRCRAVSRAHWEKALRGAKDAQAVLDALTDHPPEWWTESDGPEPPPGLTDYQRAVIEAWLGGDEAPLAPQLAVNQFLLLEKLGEGGQGEVYRGRQQNPARFVAIKTLTRDTDTSRGRFEQEARTLMRVQHPAVARFHLYERVRDEHNRPTDEYLIAMEFVDGPDLNRLVRWSGPIPWPFVVKWAIDLLGGLAAIHQNGFIHRDIKPANVIALGPPPEPGTRPGDTAAKLLDFGAVSVAAQPTSEGAKRIFVGTREYAPPEQWRERVVPESDLYALGGTLFFLLTGRPPFVVEGRDAVEFMKVHTRAPVPSATEHNADIPEALSTLLQKLMAKRPADRGSAASLIPEFAKLLPTEAVPAPAPLARKLKRHAAVPAPSAALKPARRTEGDERGTLDRTLGPLLGVLERVFLPALMRPTPGHEPSVPERVAALLTRPALWLFLLVLIGLCIFLAVR